MSAATEALGHPLPKRTYALPPTAAPAEVTLRLEAVRMALTLRPVDICRELGLGESTWSNYRGRKNRPSLDEMILFSERYEISLDWIYLGKASRLPHGLAPIVLRYYEELKAAEEDAVRLKQAKAS